MFIMINGKTYNRYFVSSVRMEGLTLIYTMSNGVSVKEEFTNKKDMLDKYTSFLG